MLQNQYTVTLHKARTTRIKGQLTNSGLPGKWLLKQCAHVCFSTKTLAILNHLAVVEFGTIVIGSVSHFQLMDVVVFTRSIQNSQRVSCKLTQKNKTRIQPHVSKWCKCISVYAMYVAKCIHLQLKTIMRSSCKTQYKIRQLSYRKDCAMRPIYGCPEKFWESSLHTWLLFQKFVMDFCSDRY